jgi:hypothetical protein
MPDETTATETAAVEPEELRQSEAVAEGGRATGEKPGGKKKDGGGRRDFDEFAFRELRRARKLFSATDEATEAQFAVQMANAAALLAVADAIRSTRGDNGSPDA